MMGSFNVEFPTIHNHHAARQRHEFAESNGFLGEKQGRGVKMAKTANITGGCNGERFGEAFKIRAILRQNTGKTRVCGKCTLWASGRFGRGARGR
jgi:hypothetical protein